MADTGSEIAEGTTRSTTSTLSRMLERQFMMRTTSTTKARPLEGDGGRAADSAEISIRCSGTGVDERAEEVLAALDLAKVRTPVGIDDERGLLTLSVTPEDSYAVLRALERLATSKRSSLTAADIDNVEALEASAGRRMVGRGPDAQSEREGSPEPEPVESVALTFANHADEPALDAESAERYAGRMRELGFDAEHREIRHVAMGEHGERLHGTSHVVGVSYLARHRDDFLSASGVALHEAGAAGREDPFAERPEVLDEARAGLERTAWERRSEYQSNRMRAAAPPTPAERAASGDLDAGEYDRMPAREKAQVPPSRVPEGSFGRQRARDAAREQARVARASRAERAPERPHPSIGER